MKHSIILAALLLCGFAGRLLAAELETPPLYLRAYFSSTWFGASRIELEGNTILFWRGSPDDRPKAERRKPTAADWCEFRRELDSIGIWKWRGYYSLGAVFDAAEWDLELKYPDRAIKTAGDGGAFPDANAAPRRGLEASEHYSRYIAALEKLMGRSIFPK